MTKQFLEHSFEILSPAGAWFKGCARQAGKR